VGEYSKKGRWSVERRLEFIDYRLYWEGRVNRGDIVAYFEVSVPQASADLTHYQEITKNNAVYDKYKKTYVASPSFRPVFFEPSADRYLAELRMIEAGLLSQDEAWSIRTADYIMVPLLRRHIDPNNLRSVLGAIRTRSSIHIIYQSMSRPKPSDRWISPHALGFDGLRWHTRAWCHTRGGFVDFLLARILSTGDSQESDIDPEQDTAWKREITLRFEPHPDLEGGARKAIELDYGMVDGVATITTRVCLTYYLERQLGLDADAPKAVRQQVVLVNRDELEAARSELEDNCGLDASRGSADSDRAGAI
jgi:hypothetical protein